VVTLAKVEKVAIQENLLLQYGVTKKLVQKVRLVKMVRLEKLEAALLRNIV